MSTMGAAGYADSDVVLERQFARLWWIFLCTGILWLLFSIVVFRFDYTTVSAISILFGIVAILAGISEFIAAFASSGWWKAARILLALACIAIGIIAFIHPGNTFKALAAVISFYFIVKGAFDVTISILAKDIFAIWWLHLLLGIAELLIGFWAAGDFGHQTILLVVWVGVLALTRGIGEIFLAFEIKKAGKAAG
jgi:uncharacterized membrane protein HdeD (DUF308 family)